MQILFCLLIMLGMLYFTCSRKRVDLFSLAFFSAFIYFLPGLFGFTSYVDGDKIRIYREIAPEVYVILTTVVFFIILSSYVNDKIIKGLITNIENNNRIFLFLIFGLCLVSFFAMFITMGVSNVLSPDKQDLLEVRNRWYVIFSVATVLLCLNAYLNESWLFLVIGFFSNLFLMYIGFRTPLALTLLSLFLLAMTKDRRVLLSYLSVRNVLVFGFAGGLLFVYKKIYVLVKLGMWDQVVDRLLDSRIYLSAIRESEPFITQDILNRTVETGLTVDLGSLKAVFLNIIVFGDKFQFEIENFSSVVNNVLYADVDYGVASNIWAEMYAIGGWPLLIPFILFFNLVIFLLNRCLQSRHLTIRAFVANLGALWVFSLHRNDLAYLLNQQKRVLLIFLIILFLSLVAKQALFKPVSHRAGLDAHGS